MPTGPTNIAADKLHPVLAELTASGADRFNPVRFCYIRSMAGRSLQQDEAVGAIVANKALIALHKYQSDLSRERAEAEALLEQLAVSHPDTTGHARTLFEAYDFQGVKRLVARLQRPPPANGLLQLVNELSQTGSPTAQSVNAGSLDALLRQQEADAVRTQTGDGTGTAPSPAQATGELRSAGYFRDSLARQHADKLVSRAALEAPEDSGPLNPQKLVIRSLAAMQDLSPAYLSRFVCYVDTLLWLDKAGETSKS